MQNLIEQDNKRYISSEVHFYTADDIAEMTGWGKKTVLKMFREPDFPSLNYGKAFIVEAHALIEYFSVKRGRYSDLEWARGELSDELKKRVG